MPSDDENTSRRSVSRRSGEVDFLDNAKYMPKLDENGKYCNFQIQNIQNKLNKASFQSMINLYPQNSYEQ